MTGRNRILAALARRSPDRLPIDFSGTDCSSIMAIAYAKLRGHLGLPKRPPKVIDIMQQIVLADEDVMEMLGADAQVLMPEPREWREWRLPDGTEALIPAALKVRRKPDGSEVVLGAGDVETMRRAPGGLYFEPLCHPLAACERPEDLVPYRDLIAATDAPSHLDEPFERFVERAKRLHRESSRALVLQLALHVVQAAQILMGFEKLLCDLLLNEPLVTAFFEMLCDAYEARMRRMLPPLAGHYDVAFLTEDLGTQQGPMFAPELYRRLVRPFHARIWRLVKELGKAPVLLHSCGAVSDFIPDMIESGVDALNPVQVSAVGMEPDRLVKKFGKRMSFWGGGCDTQKVLGSGTPEEVRAEVRRRKAQFKGAGWVFTQVHNIQADVPPENVVAMYDEARRP